MMIMIMAVRRAPNNNKWFPDSVLFMLMAVTAFPQQIMVTTAQGDRDEDSRCNPNAMVVAMSACQPTRHRLSLASQTNDTAKLCGALQRYSQCMAPRLEGCKGATRMAFDVIRTKYASHYNCPIAYDHVPTTHFYDGSSSRPDQIDLTADTNTFTSQYGPGTEEMNTPEVDYHNTNNNDDHYNDNNNNYQDHIRANVPFYRGSTSTRTPLSLSVIISNAVGIQPTVSTLTTLTNTTIYDNRNTSIVITKLLNVSMTKPIPTDTPHQDITHKWNRNTTTTVLSTDDTEKVHHAPDLNTTFPNPSNITIIIFDPADISDGSTCFSTSTNFIINILITMSACCLLLHL